MVGNYIRDPENLTQELLKKLLVYDKKTGIFYWNEDRNQYIKKGDKAGQENKEGYVRINISGRKTYAHRLAWLYEYGVWPHD